MRIYLWVSMSLDMDKRLKWKTGTNKTLWMINSWEKMTVPDMWALTMDLSGKLICTGLMLE